MFWRKYKRLDQNISVINYKGIFRNKLTLFQAVALVTSGTIGAGVLSIPYAVSKVGLGIGILYIVVLGFFMMGLNLLLGYVTVRTKENFQLVGLARKYLGKTGEYLMAVISYLMLLGVLVVYIIGEAEVLSTMFGGNFLMWGIIFWAVFGLFIIIGIRGIKTIEFVISLSILVVVLVIANFSMDSIEMVNVGYKNLAYLFLPYGVILFAFHGTTSIPEAHSLLKDRDGDFKKSIIIANIVVMIIYSLFAFVVVGVTGTGTTEIATIGLGEKVGESMFMFGNIFAILAMASSFLMIGLSLKDSLTWDYKMPSWLSISLVLGLPLIIFIAGIRQFTAVIDIVGGIFISLEMLMILLIYWIARQKGDVDGSKYPLHHTLFLVMLLLVVFMVGAVYSVMKIF